ncbi:MAG: hypothetical protein Q9181_006405, partial [Wetmoreana brouardii]
MSEKRTHGECTKDSEAMLVRPGATTTDLEHTVNKPASEGIDSAVEADPTSQPSPEDPELQTKEGTAATGSSTEQRTSTVKRESHAVSATISLKSLTEGPESSHAKTCVVCLDTLEDDNVPKHKVTAGCEHEVETCKKCLMEHIATTLEGRRPEQIK